MKTIVTDLLVSFGGSFIAVAAFVGILLVVDKIRGDDETENIQPLDEKVILYFENHDMAYEKVDSFECRFTYNDRIYFWKYDPEDPEFLRIISFWEVSTKDRYEMLSLANQMEMEWKFIKIVVDDDNDVIFAFQQVVSANSDVEAIISRGLGAFESCVHAFFKECEKHRSE